MPQLQQIQIPYFFSETHNKDRVIALAPSISNNYRAPKATYEVPPTDSYAAAPLDSYGAPSYSPPDPVTFYEPPPLIGRFSVPCSLWHISYTLLTDSSLQLHDLFFSFLLDQQNITIHQ